MDDQDWIDSMRADSRRVVRELGFMDQTLASTPYSASAVHALIEIGTRPGITAADLAEELLLDRSTVSRMLRKLVEAGELRQDEATDDRRQKALSLTDKGRHTVRAIHRFGTAQVEEAFAHLDEPGQVVARQGMHAYARALVQRRLGAPTSAVSGPQPALLIDTELRPGDIGQIVALHAREYARLSGFGVEFEALIATELGDFAKRDDPKSRIWIARDAKGTVVGSIAVDRSSDPHHAHLRWFLLSAASRGAGVGGRLLGEALEFCDSNGVEETELWTFRGLDTARTLYEKNGFNLVSEQEGARWGSTVTEQLFRRSAEQ